MIPIAICGAAVMTAGAADAEALARQLCGEMPGGETLGGETLGGERRGAEPKAGGRAELDVAAWAAEHLDARDAARVTRVAGRSALPARSAAAVALRCVRSAGLADSDLADTALLVAGNNLAARHQARTVLADAAGTRRVRPGYAAQALDTDVVGVVSELLSLRCEGWTVGAASASGTVAVIQAVRLLRAGAMRRCLVVAPVAELSLTDIRAYRESGAMAPPGAVCRPFDQNRAGFVPAQAAAAVLLDRDGPGMGAVLGVGQRLDARSGTTPHADGQVAAIRGALADARVDPAAIGYVNAHATGSAAGDPVEAAALCQVFGTSGSLRPWVNASKALLGHALTAAGLVELIATTAQLRLGFAHGNPNTVRPIPGVGGRLVGPRPQLLDGRLAVSNSFAFGGINASLVVSGEGR